MSRSSAQPPLSFIAPNLDLKIVWLTKWLLPFWMRSKTSIAEVRAVDLEKLVRVYQDFEGQKVRVLLAFRHPSGMIRWRSAMYSIACCRRLPRKWE